jgi:hypothetical protein
MILMHSFIFGKGLLLLLRTWILAASDAAMQQLRHLKSVNVRRN